MSGWIVLAEIGADFPEAFGPFESYDEGASFVDSLGQHEQVLAASLAPILPPDVVHNGSYFDDLDELLERE